MVRLQSCKLRRASDVFECDPELSTAGRIDKTIPPEKINVIVGNKEVNLTEYQIPDNRN